eukprot:12901734-Prorocentrum_lima.AAC.1
MACTRRVLQPRRLSKLALRTFVIVVIVVVVVVVVVVDAVVVVVVVVAVVVVFASRAEAALEGDEEDGKVPDPPELYQDAGAGRPQVGCQVR